MGWYARKRNIDAPALFQSGDRNVSNASIGPAFFVFLTFSLAALTQSGCGGASTTATAITLSTAAPSITAEPASQTVIAGSNVSFTAAAGGNPAPTVQWQVSMDGGATFTNVAGATSTTLTFTVAAAQNGNQYRAVFTNTVGNATTTTATLTVGNSTVQHYEYVLPDQNLYVYDMDNNFRLVKHVSIPQVQGIRGVGAVLSMYMLYISYGQFDGNNVSVPGSLLEYDQLTDKPVWTKSYSFGVDSFAITPYGSTIYMPDGENSGDGIWYIIDTATGNVTGNINTGWNGPHDTVTSLDGAFVFLGPHHSPELVEASTSTNTVVRNIGPLDKSVGPHTINGKHTLSFTTETGLFGFQVSDTTTGAGLYPCRFPASRFLRVSASTRRVMEYRCHPMKGRST